MQIGEDHQKFLRLSAECREINQQITESRRQLESQRRSTAAKAAIMRAKTEPIFST